VQPGSGEILRKTVNPDAGVEVYRTSTRQARELFTVCVQ
jgi:hypothetical protein